MPNPKTCDVSTAQENVLLNRGPPIAARPYSRTFICPIIQKLVNAFQCLSVFHCFIGDSIGCLKVRDHLVCKNTESEVCALSCVDLVCNKELCPWEMHQRHVFQWKTNPEDSQKIKTSKRTLAWCLLIEQRMYGHSVFACRHPRKLEFFSSQEETSWEGPGRNPETLRSTLFTQVLNPSQHAKCKLLSTWTATAGHNTASKTYNNPREPSPKIQKQRMLLTMKKESMQVKQVQSCSVSKTLKHEAENIYIKTIVLWSFTLEIWQTGIHAKNWKT